MSVAKTDEAVGVAPKAETKPRERVSWMATLDNGHLLMGQQPSVLRSVIAGAMAGGVEIGMSRASMLNVEHWLTLRL
jgi:hypothetical protein